MMLARDGHEVVVLERDPAPPPSPAEAWDKWDRRGVNQFRMIHFFLAQFRKVADAELPELTKAMLDAGALRLNPFEGMPAEMSGGWRETDAQYESVTSRRPVAEAVVAAMAAKTPGLTVRRGVAAGGLAIDDGPDGIPHVSGVHTDDGTSIAADVVIDAGGRRSPVAGWLNDHGCGGPVETVDDSGFVYYGRHFRSPDGSTPAAFGPLLQDYGSVSILTLPADNGSWGMGVIASSKDTALRAVLDIDCWQRVVRAFPLVAHWVDAEPITDIQLMAKIEDRQRRYVVDGVPVVTGLLPLADAWGCTNPSLGRGISMGLTHAAALRAMLRDEPTGDARALATRWGAVTDEVVDPLFTETLSYDRHRLAQIEATIAGRRYETDDPSWMLTEALKSSAFKDPELLRSFVGISQLLETTASASSRPGIAERAFALADGSALPGPDRQELLAVLSG